MEQAFHEGMKRFFSPSHIAVIGATTKNQWFSNLIKNAKKSGFEGRFYPVTPSSPEVLGFTAFPSIAALPEGLIDFAVIMVKSSLVMRSVEKLCRKGIKNILLISSGYAEVGKEGSAKQEELRLYCAANGIRLMGPNCLGFVNFTDRTSAFTGGSIEGEWRPGPVGLVGQSGAASEITATKLLKKSLGLSLFSTTGNEAVLSFEDCLEYLVHDPHTRVITGFMEGMRNVDRMKRIALEAAARQIPIILIKVGRSEKGMQAARSHTGAMAGNDGTIDGFFRQYGIIRVDTIQELVETANIFSLCRLPKGTGLCICTISGGLCGLYADLCGRYGIDLPGLSDKTAASLRKILPEFAQPDNPLDVTGSGFMQGFEEILRILLDDENLDIIAPLSFAPSSDNDVMLKMFNDTIFPIARNAAKPVIVMTFREVNEYARRYYQENGVYAVEHIEDGFKAISHLIRYARFQRSFTSTGPAVV